MVDLVALNPEDATAVLDPLYRLGELSIAAHEPNLNVVSDLAFWLKKGFYS